MIYNIKLYFYAFLGILVTIFAGWFKYRGQKIEKLEEEVQKHVAMEKKKDFEADNREAATKVGLPDTTPKPTGDYYI